MRGGAVAAAVALGALAAMGAATWAHATMPALPCGFECQWPMGSHSGVPEALEVGVPFQVSVWYAWEEVPANPAIGTAASRAAPEGYYAWPADLGPPAPPEGYTGSEVTIRLPEEMELLGYGPELERRLLWIDGNGRSTYEYHGTLPYRPGSGPQSLLLTLVLNSPVAYENTEVHADLGLSVRDAPPRVWVVNSDGAGRASVSTGPVEPVPPPARSFVEELREVAGNPSPTPSAAAWAAGARAAGGAGGAVGGAAGGASAALVPELRHKYVYPPPVVAPLPASEAPEAARRLDAAGASATDQVIVWGKFMVTGRDGNEAPAASAIVCLFDQGEDNMLHVITHTGTNACTLTNSGGYYGLAVPSTDPSGSGGPDIVVRLIAFNNFVDMRVLEGNSLSTRFEYDLELRRDAGPGFVNFDSVRVPAGLALHSAFIALSEITTAHEFFESEFGYDVPRVLAYFHTDTGAFYSITAGQIALAGPTINLSSPATVLHEYGHHVQASVYAGTYGQNKLPISPYCSPHFFDFPSSEPCAWSEGWANFVSALAAGTHIIDRPPVTKWNLETGQLLINGNPRPVGHGDAVEARISSLLWDLHDSTDERGDPVSGGTQMLWDAFRGSAEASSELPADDIHEFREDWEARGYPNLGEAFALNTIPSMPPRPASLTVHAEAGGSPKSGAGARHAAAGQSVVVTLGLGAPLADGSAPTASFFGEDPSPMERVGGGGTLWRSAHAVTSSTPEGTAVFRVTASGTEYTPASITSGGNVVVDTTPPGQPTAEFTGSMSAVLVFAEPPLPGSVKPTFAVTTASGTALQAAALHVPGSSRIVLDLGTAAGTGDHTITVPATLTDMAGNAYTGGAVTAASSHADATAPTFSVDAGSIRPLASGAEIAIEFSQGVTGSTTASDWAVDLYTSMGGPLTPTRASSISSGAGEPDRSIALSKATRLVLYTAEQVPARALWLAVRYSPDPESADRLEGEADLPPSGGPTSRGSTNIRPIPSVEEARFIDARTVRLSLDRPLEHSGGPLPLVDAEGSAQSTDRVRGTLGFRGAVTIGLSPTLGDTLVEYAPGSREVTLHSSLPAGPSAEHSLVVPPAHTYDYNTRDYRTAVVQGAGYSGALAPEGHLVASRAGTDAPSILYAYADSMRKRFTVVFTGPLDGDSLEAVTFAVSPSGTPSTVLATNFAYAPGSLKVDLLVEGDLVSGIEYTATPSGQIRGENGMAVAGPVSATATASASPELAIVSATFASPNELRVALTRPIDPASAGHVTVSGLGAVTQHYEPRSTTVTLRTEDAATGGMSYTARLLFGIRDYAGDQFVASSRSTTYTAPDDAAPPAVAMIRTVSEPDAIRVHFDEVLSPAPTSGFEVRRAGTDDNLVASVAYVAPGDGGPRVDIGLGDHELLERARYTVTVPPVSDGANTSAPATVEVEHSRAPAALGAAFTGPDSLRLDVSEPLDPSTVGGIEVVGLGETAVEYARGAAVVALRTSGTAADGTEYEILVPPTVADAGGTRFSDDGAGGPLRTTAVQATYDDTTGPGIVRAEQLTRTTTAVIFDEDVKFADATDPGPRPSRWGVSASPGGSLGVSAVGFPPSPGFVPGRGPALTPHDSGRTLVLEHGPAPPRSAVRVSYLAGGGGAVTDTASPPNALAPGSAGAADATPPSFTARTLATASTLVEFTRPLGGFTSASEWGVGGEGATSISRVGATDTRAAERVFVPQGTTSITLGHGPTGGPGETPFVDYGAPDSAALRAGTERLGALATQASDGIAPAVARADFVGMRTILLTFTEPLDAATVAAGPFSVTAAGGSGTNLLATRGAVTHHAGSPAVLLRLGADAAQAEHTVTVPASVTDANGVAYAAPDSPVAATPPQVTPAEPFTARTDSRSQVTVTFDPAVSGTTSASEWTVDGVPAAGIARVVGDSASSGPSATLEPGTTRISLTYSPLGSTGATPPVRYSPGGPALVAAGAPLGDHTTIATDGAGPLAATTRTVTRETTEVTFREPVLFMGTEAADRAAKWTVDGAAATSVGIKSGTRDATITITHAKTPDSGARPSVSYTATGDGSLKDAAGNGAVYRAGQARDGVAPSAFARFDPPIPGTRFMISVWLDEAVEGQNSLSLYRVPISTDRSRPLHLDMPGLSLAAEDGSDVPVYLDRVNTGTMGVPDDPGAHSALGTAPKSRLTLFLYETPVAGATYTLTIPPVLTDAAGNAFGGTFKLTHGTDTAGPVLERAAFTGPRALYAEFDEPLGASTVTTGSLTVKATDTGPNLLASVGYDAHSRRVTMTLNAAAAEGATYLVAATADLQDARGNAHVPGTPETATYDTTPPTASFVRYADDSTLEVSVSEPLDAGTVGSIRVGRAGTGALDVEYNEGEHIVTINVIDYGNSGLNDRREARVVIPDTVTDANGVAFEPTTLFTDQVNPSTPDPHTAVSLSRESTLVMFNPVTDRVRFGDGATQPVRVAHWTVADTRGTEDTSDDTDLEVTDAMISRDWRAVLLSHAPSAGTDSRLLVRYVAGADDAGRLRDWAQTPNVLSTGDTITMFADRSGPVAASVLLSLLHDGAPADASLPRFAKAGDMITARLALDEPAGANVPAIEILGATHGMAASPAGQTSAWTHAATVPATGAAQGELAFGVRAWDAAGNAVSLGPADLPEGRSRIVVDTMAPGFEARTASLGVTIVEFGEPVSGLLVASDWTVGGSPASGASPSPAEPPSPSLLLSGATSAALWHGPLASTSDTPVVKYARTAP